MAITLQTAGTTVVGSTSVAPAYPAGVALGRVALLKVITKPDTATIVVPGPFTSLAAGTGGTGAVGIDTGPCEALIAYRVLDGTESGTVTVTITSGNSSQGVIDIYNADNGFDAASFGGSTGGDATHGTGWSVAMGAVLDFVNGDRLVGCNACTASTSTQTSRAVSATGATFGAVANERAVHSATGNDINFGTFDFPVTGGPATGIATYTMTTSVNNSGVTAIVRLVEAAAAAAELLILVMARPTGT